MPKPFTPRTGQWVHFSLPEAMSKLADGAGAWKTRSNLFCGVSATESKTIEGVVVLPDRIMLVDEKGNNVRTALMTSEGWKLVDLWASTYASPEELEAMKSLGCIGVVEGLLPVEEKEDCPPGRRPAFHPKELHKPFVQPKGVEAALREEIAELKKMLAPKEEVGKGIETNPESTVPALSPKFKKK